MAKLKKRLYEIKEFEIGNVVFNIHKFQTPMDAKFYDFSKPLEIVRIGRLAGMDNIQVVYFKSNTGVAIPKNHKLEPFVADWFELYDQKKTVIKVFKPIVKHLKSKE